MSLNWQKADQHGQKVGYKTVVAKRFTLPDGTQAEFTTWGKPGDCNAGLVALTRDNHVLVARQFRPGPERIMDEIPGGGVDEGEEPIVAAARELREETGYVTDEPLESLGIAYRDAYMNDTNHYFLARNCYPTSAQQLDAHEFIDIVQLTIDEFIAGAKSGKMTDSVAVLMALDKLREVQHGKSN